MNTDKTSPLSIIVMGVSGCGKSCVAQALAARLNGHFMDGDDFHPPANVERMSRGVALTDADRLPWLAAINQTIRESQPDTGVNVVACSALKRLYRDVLSKSTAVLFVHLAGDFALIEARSKARKNHFMDVGLLQSQFDTLETPGGDEHVVTVNIDSPLDVVIDDAVKQVEQSSLFQLSQGKTRVSQ